jgi:transcriptional regulator with GAF, ATPase, and Fis domain
LARAPVWKHAKFLRKKRCILFKVPSQTSARALASNESKIIHQGGPVTITKSDLVNQNATALLELKIKTLYTALHDLQTEIEAIGKAKEDIEDDGTDFYEEVRRFEIYLIERALVQAKGIQKEAAKILKLRTSTLNQKIKLYNISPKYYAYQPSGNGRGGQQNKLSSDSRSAEV